MPAEATAHSLMPALLGGATARESAILGMFAGPICVTDGRYTYYRFPEAEADDDISMYTLMPSHLESLFSVTELQTAELRQPFDFTKGVPVLRVTMSPSVGEAGLACVANWHDGSCLFDLHSDPLQESPIHDSNVLARLTEDIIRHLDKHDAPKDAYRRYGLQKAQTTVLVS